MIELAFLFMCCNVVIPMVIRIIVDFAKSTLGALFILTLSFKEVINV